MPGRRLTGAPPRARAVATRGSRAARRLGYALGRATMQPWSTRLAPFASLLLVMMSSRSALDPAQHLAPAAAAPRRLWRRHRATRDGRRASRRRSRVDAVCQPPERRWPHSPRSRSWPPRPRRPSRRRLSTRTNPRTGATRGYTSRPRGASSRASREACAVKYLLAAVAGRRLV